MLFALAQSSCYWQPVPAANLYASLTSPPSSSMTSSISSSTIVSSSAPPIDGMVRLIDRCWCDLGFGLSSSGSPNFFSPFDVTRWEARSLDRERRARLRAAKAENKVEGDEIRGQEQSDKSETSVNARLTDTSPSSSPSAIGTGTDTGTTVDRVRPRRTTGGRYKTNLLSFLLRRLLPTSEHRSFDSADRELYSPNGGLANAPAENTHSGVKDSAGPRSVARPLPPRSLDLRPYGMGLVIDYGWGRSR